MKSLRETLFGPQDSLRNKLASKASEFVNGSVTVDQTDPKNVVTTETPNIVDKVKKAATVVAGAANPARGLAYAAGGLVPKKKDDPELTARINAAEIKGQTDLNTQAGYNSDHLGNRTTKIGQEPVATEVPKVEPTAPVAVNGFDVETFRKGITYNETRGAADPYRAVGPTKDLGKYQASPATLKGWSKAWVGKEYTPEEFLNDPEAQEKFFSEYTKVVERLKLSPEQAAVAWHRGWGELGTGPKATRDKRFLDKLNAMMDEDISQNYLQSFKEGTTTQE